MVYGPMYGRVLLLHCHRAVDYVDGAGGIGRFIGGEIHRQSGDLLSRTDAAHGLARKKVASGLLWVFGRGHAILP